MKTDLSLPWAEDEFLIYRGYRLSYHFVDGDMMVEFPGRKVVYIKDLYYHDFQMPRTVRRKSFA